VGIVVVLDVPPGVASVKATTIAVASDGVCLIAVKTAPFAGPKSNPAKASENVPPVTVGPAPILTLENTAATCAPVNSALAVNFKPPTVTVSQTTMFEKVIVEAVVLVVSVAKAAPSPVLAMALAVDFMEIFLPSNAWRVTIPVESDFAVTPVSVD